MIKLKPTTGAITAGTTIPLTLDFNSNPKFALTNNTISIRDLGFVEIEGGINYTATAAGAIAINLVGDGTVLATYSSVASAAGDLVTIPFYDLLRIVPTSILNGYANISLVAVDNITIAGGIVTAKYIRQ